MSTEQPIALITHKVGDLVFDATFEETHESTLNVTDNPVETGVVISDHAYMGPLKVTIEAGVSDLNLHPSDADPFASGVSRSKKAFELLQLMQSKAEPIEVQTGLRLYKSMLVTSLRAKQDKDTCYALPFTAELREVIIVSTQVVNYPPRKAGATTRQASKRKDKGEQQGKEVDQAKNGSLASKLKGIIGNYLK